MNAINRRKNKSVLFIFAIFSIIILLICLTQLSIYSLSTYRQKLKNSALKDMIGESSVVLTQDLETGRPVTMNLDNSKEADSDSSGSLSDITASEGNAASAEKYRFRKIIDKYRPLYDLNNDLKGWIAIEGTSIDYPVMQTIYEEEYYLHRDYYHQDAKEGLPFMDNRCISDLPSTNLIVYGHNMKNGTMFADLLKYEKKSFYESHKFIRFDTIYEEAIYEIIAVFRTRVAYVTEDAFRFYNFIQSDSEEEFYNYYNTIRSLSLYDIDATAISSDYLLTLATCEHSVEDGRFVVVARKIDTQNK